MKKRITINRRGPKRDKLKPRKPSKGRKNSASLLSPATLQSMARTLMSHTIGEAILGIVENPSAKLRPLDECSDKIDDGAHRWVVYSTAIATKRLMLRCVLCGDYGEVADPTMPEWSEAFHSPSTPYIWKDHGRVVLES